MLIFFLPYVEADVVEYATMWQFTTNMRTQQIPTKGNMVSPVIVDPAYCSAGGYLNAVTDPEWFADNSRPYKIFGVYRSWCLTSGETIPTVFTPLYTHPTIPSDYTYI
jgi:hypothetical protein